MRQGKPFPITDQKMSRFLLTLGQAVQLVFTATKDDEGGKIFVPKIPAANIMTLARAMGGGEYPISVTGIRPGEKIAEVLVSEEEMLRTEDTGDCYIVHPHGWSGQGLNAEFMSETARHLSVEETRRLLEDAEE